MILLAYIIDTYNKYDKWDREHAIYVFEINEVEYAVKYVKMRWGLPQLPLQVDRDSYAAQYRIYESKEEAMKFVHQMRSLN